MNKSVGEATFSRSPLLPELLKQNELDSNQVKGLHSPRLMGRLGRTDDANSFCVMYFLRAMQLVYNVLLEDQGAISD